MRSLILTCARGPAVSSASVRRSRCFAEIDAFEAGGGVNVEDISRDGGMVAGWARTAPAGAGYAIRWTRSEGLEFLEVDQGQRLEPLRRRRSRSGSVGSTTCCEPDGEVDVNDFFLYLALIAIGYH